MLPAVLGSGPPALSLCACALPLLRLRLLPARLRKKRCKRWKLKLRKGSPGGAKIHPRGAQAALRPPLGGSWGALGALLGSSWDLLGRSRPLLGRSWGSLWPPGGAFFAVFTCFFGGLARGLEKNDGFVVFVVFFVCCFGSLFEPLVPSSRCPRQAREH